MKTIYEMKQDMLNVGKQIEKTNNEISQKAGDVGTPVAELNQLKQTKDELQQRFDIIKAQLEQAESEQRTRLGQEQTTLSSDPKQAVIDAKAELIRKTMAKEAVSADVYQALGDDTTTNGGKFLPKTVANDIISEPTVKNQLRGLSTVTAIPNLEIPKVTFTLDDDDFIDDKETAKELEAKGDTVAFNRNKFKVFTGISETVLLGTNTNLVSTVERNLQSGVAAKERKVAFAETPKTGEEHMSFYDTTEVKIKEVTGADMYKAIKAAIADLHEDYRENATIMMRYVDYLDIIETLANGNATLYTAQPEQILGKPVVFCDSAVTPVVGDFSYSHYNYDIKALYEQDKDVKTGINLFVVTAWFDHRIKLASAFRLAKTTVTP